MSTKTCRTVTLALCPPVHIQRCLDCGCVSLHWGAVTLRLDDDGLEALWASIGTACVTLRELKERTEAIGLDEKALVRGLA